MSRFWSALTLWPWQYGRCRDMDSRRHRITGRVQFSQHVQNGPRLYVWLTFDEFWWNEFKPN